MTSAQMYLQQVSQIAVGIDSEMIEKNGLFLAELRKRGGRLFFLGGGWSAANCSHAVNDFRKLAGI